MLSPVSGRFLFLIQFLIIVKNKFNYDIFKYVIFHIHVYASAYVGMHVFMVCMFVCMHVKIQD